MCGQLRDVLLIRPDGMASVRASDVRAVKITTSQGDRAPASWFKVYATLKDKSTFLWAIEATAKEAQARVKDLTYAINGWAREADHA